MKEPSLDIPPPLRRPRAADVAVVGGGPTGLAIALMLAQQGRRVMIHERFATPAPSAPASCCSPRACRCSTSWA